MAERFIDLKLIVGLGNPGSEYTETRHNAGFRFVEELAAVNGAQFRAEKKFHGEVAKVNIAGRDIWLLKPQTFMNRSGQAIKSLASFYRIEPENILVAHDELDLEVGDIRLKTGGGHGGHNGLRDTIAHLGTKDFHRLRIGIGHPGNRNQVVDYVLHRSSQDERIGIDNAISNALSVMPLLADGAMEKAMHKLHTK
ncbi:MAG: aminoacyl-tRNA hydrolase [Gammaproteobacteria bacterium]|nr:aminoacyl-tRNA hydrolase [Gammaproteobacteria bacterium]MCW8923570.1 aminoacyl-tRNA hydrolase [Gammaproteobacteria bacterium]